MKKLLLTVFALLVITLSFAQSRCPRPLSSTEFNQKKQQISMGNDARKLQAAIRLSQENCITTNQVKDIAMLFTDEYSRLEYTERAYATVFDPENYYEVYDVFSKFSMAIRLYDFLNGKGTPVTTNPGNPNTNPGTSNPSTGDYPNYSYPDYNNYSGTKNCGYPINDATFETSMRGFRTQNESMKLNSLRQFVQNNCLATSQVMKAASMLTNETNRLEILRTAYDHVYDINNYSAASQIFQNRASQEQFTAFLNGNTTNPGNPNTGVCKVEDAEYNNILFAIRKESSTYNKFNVTKNITRNYTCFSIDQVRTIVKEFNIESYKLDIAKYLYDYTNPAERRQYFMVGNEFSLSSSRTNLSNFLATKGN